MLAELYLFPDRERTASELARDAKVSLPTILREVERLAAANFVLERRSGRNRYLRANSQHPLFRPVAEILQHSYGPLALLPGILADVDGIEEALIYGSWAARFTGEVGADPNDIDVLVMGTADRTALFEAARKATTATGREVNIRGITREQWNGEDDLFLRNLKQRPLVPVPLAHRVRE